MLESTVWKVPSRIEEFCCRALLSRALYLIEQIRRLPVIRPGQTKVQREICSSSSHRCVENLSIFAQVKGPKNPLQY